VETKRRTLKRPKQNQERPTSALQGATLCLLLQQEAKLDSSVKITVPQGI
jgi:hypothetical protein